ncbi:hypothetical protein ACHAWF_006111 [Thalassiosira exigua]
MLASIAATLWDSMRTWTRQNMRLFSKWRSKRSGASTITTSVSMEERQSRNLSALREAALQRETEEADDAPFSTCCQSDQKSPTVGKSSDVDAPYDEPQPSVKEPLHKELTRFFIRRSWKKKLFTCLVVLTITPVILDFVFRTGHVHDSIDEFLTWMASHPMSGVWAYIAALTLGSLVFVPPSILIFAAGFTFQSLFKSTGVPIALVASFIGSVLGGLIGFWRARYMTRDLIEVLMRRYPIIRAVDAAVVRNSFKVMFLLRMNCLIPFGVLNYAFGITGVECDAFVLAMPGILPWHALLIFLGASAETMYDEEAENTAMGMLLIGAGIVFGILGLIITWRYAKIELQREVDAAPPLTANNYRMEESSIRPWRTPSRRSQAPMVDAKSVENADLHATEYFLMHSLGVDGGTATVEYGTEDANYQERLGWSEIMLDDFS